MANDNSRLAVLIGTSAIAAVALDAGLGVVIDANGKAALTASQGAAIAGVTVESAAAGEAVQICQVGQVPIVIGTATSFIAGDNIAVDANTGKFSEGAAADVTQGRLIVAAGAANNRVSAWINVFTPTTL